MPKGIGYGKKMTGKAKSYAKGGKSKARKGGKRK